MGMCTKSRHPGWGFGTSNRSFEQAWSAVGPGQYAPGSSGHVIAPHYGFGTSPRTGMNVATSKSPGPCSYAPNHSVTKRDAPKYSASPRRMGQAQSAARSLTPGPGAYTAPGTPGCNKPSWGFGTAAQRGKQGNPAAPGPGAYHPRVGRNAPKYSMREKTSSSHGANLRTTPGPGAHGGQYTQFS